MLNSFCVGEPRLLVLLSGRWVQRVGLARLVLTGSWLAMIARSTLWASWDASRLVALGWGVVFHLAAIGLGFAFAADRADGVTGQSFTARWNVIWLTRDEHELKDRP